MCDTAADSWNALRTNLISFTLTATKTATDSKSYAGALKVLAICETAKSSLLPATLPPFYDNSEQPNHKRDSALQ
jgi:hypothetical protein